MSKTAELNTAAKSLKDRIEMVKRDYNNSHKTVIVSSKDIDVRDTNKSIGKSVVVVR